MKVTHVFSDEPPDNRANPTRDSVLNTAHLIQRTCDHAFPRRGKIRATLTMDFVSFGCEGDREPPRIVLTIESVEAAE